MHVRLLQNQKITCLADGLYACLLIVWLSVINVIQKQFLAEVQYSTDVLHVDIRLKLFMTIE